MSSDPVRHGNTIIFPASLDPKAITVVRRLTEAGFESYLVGGCVRDLLLGHIPKDFDASTEARPRQIRRVFRNCRIIGRRFKLAHVHFGDNIIEVATFRQNPSETDANESSEEERPEDDDEAVDNDDLLITRDNVYGSAEEDIRRRDFTMNALLYDVATDEVIDYVGGFEDLQNKTLRTIGDAEIRLAEDPVRMLRAVKFTSRLGLTLDADLDAAMRSCADLISRSAPPRVLEEIYKLLACGRAEASLDMLVEYGLLERLLPEVSDYWMEHREQLVAVGRAIDTIDGGTRKLGNAFLLAALLHAPWRALLEANEGLDPLATVRDLVMPAALRMNIPRRDVAIAKQLLMTQLRLERPRRSRRFRMNDFLNRSITVDAVDLLYLRCLAGAADPEHHAEWAERLAQLHGPPETEGRKVGQSPKAPRTRRRRRRRRGGRDDASDNRGSNDSLATADEGSSESAPAKGASSRSNSRAPRDGEGAGRKPSRRRRSSGASATKTTDAGNETPAPADTGSQQTTAGPTDSSTEQAGLGGKVRSWFRRILGSPESGDAGDAPAEASPRPAGAQAGAARRTETTEPVEAPADATAGASDDDGDTRDGKSSSRPRRRRRRRRGTRADGQSSSSTSEASAAESASDEGSGKEQPTGKPADKPASTRRRRSRGGRGRGGSGGQDGGKGRSSTSKDRSGSGTKSAPRPKRRKSSDRDGDSKRSQRSERTSSTSSGPPTPQNRPEDIEDVFDW